MPVFQYKAIGENRRPERGTLIGDSPRDVRDQLRSKGLAVVDLKLSDSASDNSRTVPTTIVQRLSFRRKWIPFVASVTGDLSTLLAVGVPLLEALDTLIRQYSGRRAELLMQLRDRIASGQSLAEAMKASPEVFDTLCTSMVSVGESTGNLDEVLEQLSRYKRRSLAFRDRLISSLLYPAIVLAVSLLVTGFLMTIVVPMLLQNLVDAGRPLPWPTRILKFASDTMAGYGGWIFLGLIATGIAGFLWFRTERGRYWWCSGLLKVPILGNISRKQEISRVALVIATLLKSGVEFLNAVDVAKGTTRNVLLLQSLDECRERVRAGKELGEILEKQPFFTPLAVQVFSVGQSSGRLPEMLTRLAEDYDAQVELAADRLSAVIEPVLIIGLSLFVGFILLATLLPILEAGNVLA